MEIEREKNFDTLQVCWNLNDVNIMWYA